jgi:hypothetical protein
LGANTMLFCFGRHTDRSTAVCAATRRIAYILGIGTVCACVRVCVYLCVCVRACALRACVRAFACVRACARACAALRGKAHRIHAGMHAHRPQPTHCKHSRRMAYYTRGRVHKEMRESRGADCSESRVQMWPRRGGLQAAATHRTSMTSSRKARPPSAPTVCDLQGRS